jgi:hypothetical protein
MPCLPRPASQPPPSFAVRSHGLLRLGIALLPPYPTHSSGLSHACCAMRRFLSQDVDGVRRVCSPCWRNYYRFKSTGRRYLDPPERRLAELKFAKDGSSLISPSRTRHPEPGRGRGTRTVSSSNISGSDEKLRRSDHAAAAPPELLLSLVCPASSSAPASGDPVTLPVSYSTVCHVVVYILSSGSVSWLGRCVGCGARGRQGRRTRSDVGGRDLVLRAQPKPRPGSLILWSVVWQSDRESSAYHAVQLPLSN